MDRTDRDHFSKIMAFCGTNYEKLIPADAQGLYFKLLSDHSLQAVEGAFKAHMLDPNRGRWFPKVADITHQIEKHSLQVEDKAELAWQQIMNELESSGSHGGLDIDDKQAIAAVKAMGGWQKLCRSTYDQLIWIKKEFFSIYDTYERTPVELLPAKLPGLIELEEHKRNRGVQIHSGPEQIGDLLPGMKLLKEE